MTQEGELFVGFNTLGGHREPEDLAKPDHDLRDDGAVGITHDDAHE